MEWEVSERGERTGTSGFESWLRRFFETGREQHRPRGLTSMITLRAGRDGHAKRRVRDSYPEYLHGEVLKANVFQYPAP